MATTNTYFKKKAALKAVNKNLQTKGYTAKQAYAIAGKMVLGK